MSRYEKELEMIKKARAYDTAGNLKISKEAEAKIINIMDEMDIEFEEAAELLIEIGYQNI